MTWRRGLLVLVALVVINLPWVLTTWRLHQVDTQGVRVTAVITAVNNAGSGNELVDFRLPASIDPAGKVRTATIDAATYTKARASHRIGVRVLRGDPAAYRVDGQVRSHLGGIVTVIGDVLVLLLVLLSLRLGGTRRPPLVALALADVQEGGPDPVLDKQADGTYVICGAIRELGPDSLVLSVSDREVTVHLQGHANPVTAEQPAMVRAQLVG